MNETDKYAMKAVNYSSGYRAFSNRPKRARSEARVFQLPGHLLNSG